MTKQFCDICGHIAADGVARTRTFYPALKWTGTRSSPGSIDSTDGNWIPHIDAHVVFRASEFEKMGNNSTPDLCVECQAKILQQMATEMLKGRG